MAIRYKDIEFDEVADLVEYQKKTGMIEDVPAPRSGRKERRPDELQRSDKLEKCLDELEGLSTGRPAKPKVDIKEFYFKNLANENLKHGSIKKLAKMIGRTENATKVFISKMKRAGELMKDAPVEAVKRKWTKRAPKKFQRWTDEDDKVLLLAKRKFSDEDGKVSYNHITRIMKEVGRTRASVYNRLFQLQKQMGK